MDAVGFVVTVICRQIRCGLLTVAALPFGHLLQRDALRLAARLLDLHRFDALLDLLYLLLQTLQLRLPAIAGLCFHRECACRHTFLVSVLTSDTAAEPEYDQCAGRRCILDIP